MVEIYFETEELADEIQEDLLDSMLNHLQEFEGFQDEDFSLSFVSEETIAELNKEYRDIDGATDVLTFTNDDDTEEDFIVPEGFKELGDIFICVNKVKENAKNFNVSFNEELLRLIIHGYLHLIGYDHETNEFDKEEMLILQENLVKSFSF